MSFMSMTVEWDFPGIRGQRIISHLGIDHWSLENSTESMIVLENVHPTESSRLWVMISLHSLSALNKIALQPKRVYKNLNPPQPSLVLHIWRTV